MQKIQVSIAGFQGQATTIIGAYNEDKGVLVIAKEVKYREERVADDFAVVANVELPVCDFTFTDKHLRDAIRAYYSRKAQGTLDLPQELLRYEPDNAIELQGVDEGGRRYQLRQEITNGQIAILAAVAFVESQKPIQAAISAAHELEDFYGITTI